MTSSRLLLAATALTALACMGCKETVSSANIRTQGIAMFTEVVATSGTDVIVTSTLQVGGGNGTYVILDSGDAIYLEVDGERSRMLAESDGVYEGRSNVGDEDTEYRVILERELDDPADDSRGSLPGPFEFTSAFGSAEISRELDDLEVTWDPADSGDDMEIEFREIGCVVKESIDIGGDSGSYTLAAGELRSTASSSEKTCDVEVTMTRTRGGSTDSNLNSDSRFTLIQTRSFTLVSAP